MVCAPVQIAFGLALAASSFSPAHAQEPTRIISVDPVQVADGTPGGMTLRLTFPDAAKERLPTVILTHGNRLSRTDYQPVVTALAKAGYLVIQPDHGDASVDGFTPATAQPANVWRTRINQVRWIANNLTTVGRQAGVRRLRIDASRIAIVGHSFGGQTAVLAMGASIAAPDSGKTEQFGLPALRGAVLLAPPGDFAGLVPAWQQRAPYLKLDWRTMRGSVLTIAGDADDSSMTDQGPAWHEAPWRLAHGGDAQDQCLMRVPGGHYLGGIDSPLRAPAGDATPERRARVLGAIVAFVDQVMGRENGASRWATLRTALLCK